MSLTDQERAALRMLAAAIRGQSLSTMLARGFTIEMLQGLVSAGLATANRDAIGAARAKVAHLRITEAGRQAIAD
jgi:hypothetical protein